MEAYTNGGKNLRSRRNAIGLWEVLWKCLFWKKYVDLYIILNHIIYNRNMFLGFLNWVLNSCFVQKKLSRNIVWCSKCKYKGGSLLARNCFLRTSSLHDVKKSLKWFRGIIETPFTKSLFYRVFSKFRNCNDLPVFIFRPYPSFFSHVSLTYCLFII